MDFSDSVRETIHDLRAARTTAFVKCAILASKKRQYKIAEAELLMAHSSDPKALGHNAETRDANILLKLKAEWDAVQDAMAESESANHELSLALLGLEELRMLIEITKPIVLAKND